MASVTATGRPDYRIQDIRGSLGCWSEPVFSTSHSSWPYKAPQQGTPRYEPPLQERVSFFGEGSEILEKAPGFRCYSSFSQHFQEKVGESIDRSFSPSSLLVEISSPPIARHPLTVPNSICRTSPCFVYEVSSCPLWFTFYHFKSLTCLMSFY